MAFLCEEEDSNLHSFRNQILSLARLPVPPSSRNYRSIPGDNSGTNSTRTGSVGESPDRPPERFNRHGTSRHNGPAMRDLRDASVPQPRNLYLHPGRPVRKEPEDMRAALCIGCRGHAGEGPEW